MALARRPPLGFAPHLARHFRRHGPALVAGAERQCDAAAAGGVGVGAGAAEDAAATTASSAPPPPAVAAAPAAAPAPSVGFTLALRRMLPTLRAVFPAS